jgi:hypothetical protein
VRAENGPAIERFGRHTTPVSWQFEISPESRHYITA